MSAVLKATTHGLTAGFAARAIKTNVADMAERFLIGEEAPQALPILRGLHQDGIAATVDILGEATISDAEADASQARYLALIDTLADAVVQWPADAVIDSNHLGSIPRANVSLKVSALAPHLDAVDPVGSVSRLKERVLPLFLRAKEKHVFLNVDLEQWALHGITYDLFEELLSHPALRTWPHVGIVVQAHLVNAGQDLEQLQTLARQRGAPITVRLVKGALGL
jgi:RHH-type transcriptional regulator, proline utilization regulon repressor / proline dehydrogenase / delta 1-pyrroline-5-carboxylate dehydrogenase